MGKKSRTNLNSKSMKGDTPYKETGTKLSVNNRNKLNKLVNNLLQVTSDGNPLSVSKAWEIHLNVHEILEKIISLERDLEINEPVRSGDSFEKFKVWMEKNGSEINTVEICEFPDVGYGLKAVKDIDEATKMLTVPRKLMLTSENVQTSPLKKLWEVDPLLHNMPNVVLAFLLLLQRFDKNSFWFPYISILPNTYNTVMYFTPDELQQLKGSPVFEKALKQCRSIARHYAYYYNIFQTSKDSALKCLKENFTYSSYRWAVSTVMTRQNAIPGEDGGERTVHALIPFWDMCNHTDAPMTTEYNVETGRCECYAYRKFSAGEEVRISYGKRANSELLLHNGFVAEGCSEDAVLVKLGVSRADPLFEAKSGLLARLGVPSAAEFPLAPGERPFPPSLVTFLRVFNLDKEGFAGWEDKLKRIKPNSLLIPLSSAADSKIWTFLKLRINLLLSAYPTTLQEDEELLKVEQLSERSKLSVLMRITEKRILVNALDFVINKLSE